MKYTYFFFLALPCVLGDNCPILSLKTGTIQGHYMTSRNGSRFASYEGIPYAIPPLRELRWKAPQPMAPWEGVLNCTQPPPMCSQDYGFGLGQEDCLYLNLYHPLGQNMSSLPVMVWIHGGGHVLGAGARYGPEFLMDEQVVLITINYRLGVLGFLSLDTPHISGNQGLRDQTLALTWVKENLKPSKVTIFGESSGSWSVSHHILSPQSNGLFQAAIGQSGTIDNGLAFKVPTREEAFEETRNFAVAINCFNGSNWNAAAVLDCLNGKSGALLIHLSRQYGFLATGNVDDISKDGPILPSMPQQLLQFGLFNQVPVIWGTNKGEGSSCFYDVMEDPNILDTYDETWAFDGARMMFNKNWWNNGSDFGPHDVEYAMAARDFYFDGVVSAEKLNDFVDLLTDTYYLRPIHNMVLDMSDFVPVYQYQLSFRDETSWTGTPGPENLDLGPTHFDDIPYLFKFIGLDYSNWSEANLVNSQRMCKMWANFAREMDPTPGDEVGVKWEKVSKDNHKYLDIGEQLVMDMSQEYTDRMDFWDTILARKLI